MHPDVKRKIESYVFTIYPTTLELVANWLDNGSELNEMDWWRASFCKQAYERRRMMDKQWEPFAVTLTLNMAGILLDEVYARIEALDSMLATNSMGDPDTPRMMRERERLMQDRKELARIHL